MPLRAAWFLPHVQRGGYGTIRTRNAAKPLSSISLIPLWLSPVNRPSRFRRERKAGTRATPPKSGGACDPDSGTERRTSIPVPWGSLSTSFIPAGRLRKTPFSPRASSCRIGPRRQVFASPLRALDGSGSIRKTRCLRGERGGRAVERGAGEVSRMLEELSGPLARDKDIIIHIWGEAERNLSAIPAI